MKNYGIQDLSKRIFAERYFDIQFPPQSRFINVDARISRYRLQSRDVNEDHVIT